MAHASPRTHFHSARLIHTLSDLTLLEGVPPGAALAERLAGWVAFTDAIRLGAVHASVPPVAPAASAAPSAGTAAEALSQARAALEQAIVQACAALEAGSDYEPWRRHYAAQQREMEARLGPLRAQLRAALGRAAGPLRQLAALDAAFDGILSEREARLLAGLPLLLNKRFLQLRRAAQPADAEPDDAAIDGPAPGWLAGFAAELQSVLLAELDLRLQPLLGLAEALDNPNPNPA